jgi:succinate dehydrogenase / fumarate reductase flavoprotein subunit
MGYPDYMRESIKKVTESRPDRVGVTYPRLTMEQAQEVLENHHPDFKEEQKRRVRVGPNKGDLANHEFVDVLEAHPAIMPDDVDLTTVDWDVDVLIIGGGGAGCAAALMAQEAGVSTLVATKLRLGDANTMMAQGGIQAATKPNDTPSIHYLDVIGGGHFTNKPELVEALVHDAPLVIKWHEELGVMYDKLPDGTMVTIHGGGTSRKRMHSARDYSGGEIMKTLRDEVRNRPEIEVVEFLSAIELLMDDKGACVGAVMMNTETREYKIVRAKATIIATGGFGRLHIQGFETTNHYGATADGIVMAYHAGAKWVFMESVQYHPTGAVFPEQIVGLLVTEKVRGLGAQVLNIDGEQFTYPLEPRDIESSKIIREVEQEGKGICTPTGKWGVWLDSPIIDLIHGPGTIEKQLPAMVRQYRRFDIDITKEPILIYPTLHYQNGGIDINAKAETSIPGLYAAGEVAGGIHGTNRLMGNSLLDVNVFGRRAGLNAVEYIRKAKPGKPSLDHLVAFEGELKSSKVKTDRRAPILLPDYRPEPVLEHMLDINQ